MVDDERIAELINTALNCKPAQATQWSVRTLAAQTGLSSGLLLPIRSRPGSKGWAKLSMEQDTGSQLC
jgi:hypothetical protein